MDARPDDKYKQGKRWFAVLLRWEENAWKFGEFAAVLLGFGILVVAESNRRSSSDGLVAGLILVAVGAVCLLRAIVPRIVLGDLRQHRSPALRAALRAYRDALDKYDADKRAAEAAAREAQAAARAAARDAELRKHSHWASLDPYTFERETAEVLCKHQFTAKVTQRSGDGGVDIRVTRNRLRGVVQCKAHVASVGPDVVRSLYGVMRHCRASFGIIVSRGGFTRGAAGFARDKPIHLLKTDDLIAMQEGRDVLAQAFAGPGSSRVQ